jgi:hypothetical protein
MCTLLELHVRTYAAFSPTQSCSAGTPLSVRAVCTAMVSRTYVPAQVVIRRRHPFDLGTTLIMVRSENGEIPLNFGEAVHTSLSSLGTAREFSEALQQCTSADASVCESRGHFTTGSQGTVHTLRAQYTHTHVA